MNPDAVCAYCAQERLTGDDRPEHVVPYALGGSFAVATVCNECNEWASREIDQPFLRDDFVLMLRSSHGIRDPQPRRSKPIPNPLFKGQTETGAFARMDDDGEVHVQGQIIDRGDGRFEIRATSMEEAEKLVNRLKKRAEGNGQSFEIGEFQHSEGQVEISGTAKASTAVWARLAAKIALATGSHVFDAAWRKSPEAEELRRILHDEPSKLLGEKPSLFPKKIEEPISLLIEEPNHALIFLRGRNDQVLLTIVLFGEYVVALPIASIANGLPRVAWLLDPNRPNASGETTFDQMMMDYVVRVGEEPDADEGLVSV